jgi:Methyltransferase domain
MSMKRLAFRVLDIISIPFVLVLAPIAALLARSANRTPWSRAILDKFHVAFVRHHYYAPVVFPEDLRTDLNDERPLPGLDLNEKGQLALLESFHYRDELLAIQLVKTPAEPTKFGYHNATFETGDAEFLYNMIRHFKPRRIVEIGSGNSTLMARIAVDKNLSEDSQYRCDQICIEPFEQPWLESIGVKIVRQQVERCPDETFTQLQAGDILFIDSSHVIRPQGDVVHEFLYLLGLIQPGVLVHVHDVFTPRDYPARWVLGERWMRNEQYLLEAFLSFNPAFEIIGAVNWLSHHHRDKLQDACPLLVREPEREPGSFWFRRI